MLKHVRFNTKGNATSFTLSLIFQSLRFGNRSYSVFTLPGTETDTDTDEKWVVKNCVQVFTLHRHNNAIEYCYNLSGSVSVSVSVSGSVNAPLRKRSNIGINV